MKTVDLETYIDVTDITDKKVRLRKRIKRKRAKVTEFVIQLEIERNHKYQVIVRIDSFHDFVHKDEFFPNRSKQRTKLPFTGLKEASIYAENNIRKNIKEYVRRWI